jgi:hypothetical protein
LVIVDLNAHLVSPINNVGCVGPDLDLIDFTIWSKYIYPSPCVVMQTRRF